MRRGGRFGLCIALVVIAAGVAFAQTVTTEVRTGEVLWVNGNTVVVRGPEGTKEFLVSDDARFNMDGKQLTVHELKPGMKFAAVITTTTTPVQEYAEEVRSAEVIQTLGTTIVVKNQDGVYKKYTADDLKGIKVTLMRDGKQVTADELQKGDKITATVITKLPPTTVTDSELQVYVKNTPPPPAPKPAPVAAPKPAAAAPPPPPPPPAAKKLPKTGSPLPLVAAIGLVALALGAAMTVRRRWASR